MIALLCCKCHGSESMLRRFVKNQGVKDWMKTPVFVGKEKSVEFLSQFGDSDSEVRSLKRNIENHGRYAVVFGYNEGRYYWSDIADNSVASKVDAELIIENFA